MTGATLVFDEGPGVGLGHRRRMEGLGAALADAGVEVRLVATGARVDDDLVVVDSYRWRADDPTRFGGRLVAAIDDLARDLAVAVVVDPAPGARAARHPAAGHVLAGARYALLGPIAAPGDSRDGAEVRRILVTCGASDVDGRALDVALAIADRVSPTVSVAAVAGDWTERPVPPRVHAVRAPHGLGAELAAADLVVCAGGVTMLEALAAGRPTVTVVVAENQRAQAEGAAAAGATLLATLTSAAERAAELVDDPARRTRLAQAGRCLVDGQGSTRVARALVALLPPSR